MDKHHIYKTWADISTIEYNKTVQRQRAVILQLEPVDKIW